MATTPSLPSSARRPRADGRPSGDSSYGATGGGQGPGGSATIRRIPPHSFEAEESLLGAMLLSRDAIAIAVEEVSGDDFYKPSHAHIFSAVSSLYARGEPADSVTVAEEMRRLGTLDASGGSTTLLALQANTPAISSATRYARIVQEHAVLRRLIGVAYEIAEMGFELPTDVVAAVDRAEAMVFEVAQRRVNDSTRSLKELLSESLDHLEHLYDMGETITGVATGYRDLDHLLYGLQPANLVVVGARPSMGKTAFALGMATHAARIGTPTLFFSLEMSHLELAQRVLCAEAQVDAGRLRNGKLVESDWQKIAGAIGRVGTSPLYIDDNPNVTVMDIRAKARRMKASETGLGLVIVDYLQLMTGRSSAESRQVEISEMSRGLKILARELQIPVVALSQLSRSLESRADKRPMLADLRECLTGDTLVSLAGDGTEGAPGQSAISLGELARSGGKNLPVWSLDEDFSVVPAVMAQAWSTGAKPVFEVALEGGRCLRATANHPLLTTKGWTAVGELALGDLLAVVDFRSPVPGSEHLRSLAGGGRAGAPIAMAPAQLLADPGQLAWHGVEAISPAGEEEVFDCYVPGTHSFLANGIVSHNSGAIEQDADVVMFIYRDDVYNPESTEQNEAEIIISKHRNGPTGVARLAFRSNIARFADLAKM